MELIKLIEPSRYDAPTNVFRLMGIAAAVFAADFVSGLVHWAEDVYIREDTAWIGKYITPGNRLHHRQPREMTKKRVGGNRQRT